MSIIKSTNSGLYNVPLTMNYLLEHNWETRELISGGPYEYMYKDETHSIKTSIYRSNPLWSYREEFNLFDGKRYDMMDLYFTIYSVGDLLDLEMYWKYINEKSHMEAIRWLLDKNKNANLIPRYC